MVFQKGHIINKGRKLTDEVKKKIGFFQKGKIVSSETRIKMGNSQRGKIISDKTREKLRIKSKNFFSNQKNRELLSIQAKKQWQQVGFKEKMSKMRKGRVITPEWKKNLSLSLKGKKGRIKSEEEKRKISEKVMGHIPWNKGIPRTEEVKNKISQKLMGTRMGPLNHKWIGTDGEGIKRVRGSVENKLWRKAVFERDVYTCQKCGQHGGELRSHHIFNFSNYLELRFAIDNGITFCKKCHNFFHRKYGIKNNTKEQLIEYLNN